MRIKGYQIAWPLPVLLVALLAGGAFLLISSGDNSEGPPAASQYAGALPGGYDALSAAEVIIAEKDWPPAQRAAALAYEQAKGASARPEVIAALSVTNPSRPGITLGEETTAPTETSTRSLTETVKSPAPGASPGTIAETAPETTEGVTEETTEGPATTGPSESAPGQTDTTSSQVQGSVPSAQVTVRTVLCKLVSGGCDFQPLGDILVEIRGPRDLNQRSDGQGRLTVSLPVGDYILKAQGAPALLAIKYHAAGGAVTLQVVAR